MPTDNFLSRLAQVLQSHESRRPSFTDRAAWPLFALDPGGHNDKFVVTEAGQTRWFVKRCDNTEGRIPDICRREELVSVLGTLIPGVRVVDAWVVPTEGMSFPRSAKPLPPTLVRHECVVMPFLKDHRSLQEGYQVAVEVIRQNAPDVASILAFLHWLGDEDRGTADVMFSDAGLTLIDNGLCAPNGSSRLRGAHPHP